MATVVLVLHLMIALGLIGVVLMQRSEGGGLGMGGGGGGFMTGRGTANLLTRATAGLAAAFFCTSIALTLLAKSGSKSASPLDLPRLAPIGAPATPGPAGSPPAPPTTPTPANAPTPAPANSPAAGPEVPKGAASDAAKGTPPPKSQ